MSLDQHRSALLASDTRARAGGPGERQPWRAAALASGGDGELWLPQSKLAIVEGDLGESAEVEAVHRLP